MANIKISELNPLLTVQDADVLPIVDNAITKKVTAAILRSYTEGNSVLLTGAQTIAGIKTFTSQLASSVATGTAPFSVASTTKVTNLNADLLDGLSSADFQATLSGTGIVKSTAGTISYLTDNSSNWNTAYNDSIVSAAVTGTTTKLLTLNQQDGGTITASWSDIDTAPVSSVFGRTGAIVATSGDYTTTQVTEGTNLYFTDARARAAISLTTTGTSGVATYVSGVLNIPNYGSALSAYVPYTGATTNVNLGLFDLYTAKVWLKDVPNDTYGSMELTDGVLHFEDGDGHSMVTMEDGYLTIANASTIRALLDVSALSVNRDFAFPNASGTLALTSDLTAYVPTTRTVSTTSPLTGGGALSSNLTLSIPQASGSVNGYLGSTDFATFNAKQNAITLTTTGTSGAATLVGSTLNIPNYADTDTGITSLNGLTALTQTFAVGTSGTDFGISSATSTHTFNLPTASASNRGALSSADWTTFNNKQNALTNPITGTGTTNYLPKFTGASALGNSLIYDSGTNIGIGITTPSNKLVVSANDIFNQDNSGQITIVGASDTNKTLLIGFDTTSNYGYLQAIWKGNSTKPLVLQPFSGNVLLGTTTDSGYKLDVNGTARVSGNITLFNGASASGKFSLSGTQSGARSYSIENVISGISNSGLQIFDETAGSKLLYFDSTGAATFSGAIAINNSVAAAVAVASTHKVTIVIGGVTYYLLASNV